MTFDMDWIELNLYYKNHSFMSIPTQNNPGLVFDTSVIQNISGILKKNTKSSGIINNSKSSSSEGFSSS